MRNNWAASAASSALIDLANAERAATGAAASYLPVPASAAHVNSFPLRLNTVFVACLMREPVSRTTTELTGLQWKPFYILRADTCWRAAELLTPMPTPPPRAAATCEGGAP